MPIAPKPLHIGPAATAEQRRQNSHQRGYTRQWSNASKRFLAANPWCVHCEARGEMTPATDTDHKIPHRGNLQLLWDPNNWQALCKSCHSIKTKAGL